MHVMNAFLEDETMEEVLEVEVVALKTEASSEKTTTEAMMLVEDIDASMAIKLAVIAEEGLITASLKVTRGANTAMSIAPLIMA